MNPPSSFSLGEILSDGNGESELGLWSLPVKNLVFALLWSICHRHGQKRTVFKSVPRNCSAVFQTLLIVISSVHAHTPAVLPLTLPLDASS